MKIATVLFTYNRSYHTKQVIDALKHNIILPQKLFIFQDGLKQGMDGREWEKVNDLIYGIDWCDKEIIVSQYNRGLADSIVTGINYAFRDYEATIVLEDDCVSTSNFICFMQQCLEKYKNNKKIYSISGYNLPLSLKKKKYDIYGCGRISSWGWATWKDRWDIFEKDYELVKKMKKGKKESENLALWGSDLEEMLVANVRGNIDSWAVFWALNVIAREGICIYPYESFIRNIGTDGSGVHCGITSKYDVDMIYEEKKEFCLPDNIGFLDETKKAFVSEFGGYTAISKEDGIKEKVLIYGLGSFYVQNEKKINEKYYVEAFIDTWKRGWFAGKKILKLNDIEKYRYDKIIVMIRDVQECKKVMETLTKKISNVDIIISGHDIV